MVNLDTAIMSAAVGLIIAAVIVLSVMAYDLYRIERFLNEQRKATARKASD